MGGPSVPGLNIYKKSHTAINTIAGSIIGYTGFSWGLGAIGIPVQTALAIGATVMSLSGGIIAGYGSYKADTTLAPKGVANLADSFVSQTGVSSPIVKDIAPDKIAKAKKLNKEIDKLQREERTYSAKIKERESKMEEVHAFEDLIKDQIQELDVGVFGWLLPRWLRIKVFDAKMNRLERSDLVTNIQRLFADFDIPNPRTELRKNPVIYLQAFIKKHHGVDNVTHDCFIDQAYDKFDAQKAAIKDLKKAAKKNIVKLQTKLRALRH